jgi:hypothetical protein
MAAFGNDSEAPIPLGEGPLIEAEQKLRAIVIFRQEVRFTDKQVGLVSSFATQAVIANTATGAKGA